VDANASEEELLKDLTRNSYEIVKAKYTKNKQTKE
jgi:predicted DNA-binding protein (MmcQ/YjbR family)